MQDAKRRKNNMYWFFRSLFSSGVLVFCALLLVIGCAECYAVMQRSITGEPVALIELKQNDLLILGRKICSAGFFRWLAGLFS